MAFYVISLAIFSKQFFFLEILFKSSSIHFQTHNVTKSMVKNASMNIFQLFSIGYFIIGQFTIYFSIKHCLFFSFSFACFVYQLYLICSFVRQREKKPAKQQLPLLNINKKKIANMCFKVETRTN